MTTLIYIGFMAVMLLGFGGGMMFMSMWSLSRDGSKKKKTLLLLRNLGLFIPIYLGIFYFAHQSLLDYFERTCGPNAEEVKIMFPQTEIVKDYLLKNGPPQSMKDIPNLPTLWNKCERTSKNVERCYFHIHEKEYVITLDFFADSYVYLKTYDHKSETGLTLTMKKDSGGRWFIESNLATFSTKDDGICNPMRM